MAGDALGGEAHDEQRRGVVGGEPRIGAGLVAADGNEAHGFGSASHDDARATRADALIGQCDGLKAGGAEAVDGGAWDLDRQARSQCCPAGDVPALLALGLRAAEDYIVDGRLVEGGNPIESAGEGRCGKIIGAKGGERAFGGAANGGANGGDEDGFRHGGSYLLIYAGGSQRQKKQPQVLRLPSSAIADSDSSGGQQESANPACLLILHVDAGPGAHGIKVIDRAAVDDGVGDGVVVEARRGMAHAELRFMNVLRGCGINSPVEAEDVA